jgi:hypothetical protein
MNIIIQAFSYFLIYILINFGFLLLAKYLKSKGYESYTDKEITNIKELKISPFVKMAYWLNLIVFFPIMFVPLIFSVLFAGKIEIFLFNGAEIHYLCGLYAAIPILLVMGGSFLLGVSLAISMGMMGYFIVPEFEFYEMQMRSKKEKIPDIYKIKGTKLNKKIFIISLLLVPLFSLVLFAGFYNYTNADNVNIYQRYFFSFDNYKWANVVSSKLLVDYKKSEKGEWQVFPQMELVFNNGKKISLWKDNGFARPDKEELFWLIDKIKSENIKTEVTLSPSSAKDDVPKKYKDYWERIYPVIQKISNNKK